MPHIEMRPAPSDGGTREVSAALMRAVTAAADQARDETTVLLIGGAPATVIAPYGHDRRPGAAANIAFDQTAPPEARRAHRYVGRKHPHEH